MLAYFVAYQLMWYTVKEGYTVNISSSIIASVAETITVQKAGPAESVWLLQFWLDQFFLKVKAKFHFCKRQVINKVLV